MFTQLRASYAAHVWTRRATAAGLCMVAVALLVLGGGFPPWAWRFLAQATPQLPRLWAMHGLGVIVPYSGLLLLSLTFALLWGALVFATIVMLRHWLKTRLDMRDFERDQAHAKGAANMADVMRGARVAPVGQAPSLAYHQAPARQSVATAPPATRNVRYKQRALGVPAGSDDSANSDEYSMPRDYARYVYRPTAPLAMVDAAGDRDDKDNRYDRDDRDDWGGDLPQSVIHLDVGTALDSGIKRRGQPNEDSLLALPHVRPSRKGGLPLAFFVVADGMGGHGDGQEASRLAISSMHDAMQLALLDGLEDEVYEELLAEGVHNANLMIYRRNQQKQANMGTTLTAALIAGNTAYIANVGDSRTYLYRDEEGLKQITRDHSAVARLVEVGAIAPQDVYTHPKRNEIYRSLGQSASVKVDTYRVPLKIGDLLLLCSDGLWEMVYDADIQQLIVASLPATAQVCDALLQAALRGGGKDNISMIAIGVRRG